jgi:hypothetical protein
MPAETMTIPRRTRVDGHRGIYWRPGAGRRSKAYEITFVDETGRPRWETIDGGLGEAVA